MKCKLWEFYIKINYCGQKIAPSFFVKQSVINITMFELSFLITIFPTLFVAKLGIRNQTFIIIFFFTFILLLWKLLETRVRNSIDFDYLEKYYKTLTKKARVGYFIWMLLLFFLSIGFLLFSFKMVK